MGGGGGGGGGFAVSVSVKIILQFARLASSFDWGKEGGGGDGTGCTS